MTGNDGVRVIKQSYKPVSDSTPHRRLPHPAFPQSASEPRAAPAGDVSQRNRVRRSLRSEPAAHPWLRAWVLTTAEAARLSSLVPASYSA